MKFPFYQQHDSVDCGATCLRMIARHYGKYYSLQELRERTYTGKEGASLLHLAEAAQQMGLLTKAVAVDIHTLLEGVSLPCIAHWQQGHFVVIYQVTKNHVYVADPAVGRVRYRKEDFIRGWQQAENQTGILLLLEPLTEFLANQDSSENTNSDWKLLATFFRPYRRYLHSLLVGILVLSLIQLTFPFLTQALVDEGIRQDNLHLIYILLIAQLVLFTSQAFGEAVQNYMLLFVGSRVSLSLLSNFLHKLVQLPHAFFAKKNLGDLLQRIDDNERVEAFFTQQSITLVFSVVNVIVLGFVLAWYHWLVFTIFVVGTFLYVFWLQGFSHRRLTLEQQRFTAAAREQGQLHDLLYGMPEIRLNGSQQRRRQRWEAVRIGQHQITMRTLAVEQWQAQGGQVLHELKNIGLTFFTAMLVIQGEMTLGMLIAVQYILGQLNAPFLNLVEFLQSAQDAKLSFSRIGEVYRLPPEDNRLVSGSLETNLSGSIQLSDVSFHYEGSYTATVLDQFNITIPEGKVTAIVGASGSGKTTLLKLLLKCYELSEGSIDVGYYSLNKLSASMWLSHCGVVMQDGYIFDDTILANITESDSQRPLDKERLAHAVRIAHVDEYIHRLPNGYHTTIGQNGMGLSGGQRQRILIARAVYKDPQYLFFDEATSALDAHTERAIVNNLETFFQDRTVVVVAHRLSTVKHADQIVVLDQGKVVEQGTHTVLTKRQGAYYHLVKNQLELGV